MIKRDEERRLLLFKVMYGTRTYGWRNENVTRDELMYLSKVCQLTLYILFLFSELGSPSDNYITVMKRILLVLYYYLGN